MSENRKKPFSIGYVLRVTMSHARKKVDLSIRKTFARVGDFPDNQEKSAEVFETLAQLHALRKALDDFQIANQDKFRGE